MALGLDARCCQQGVLAEVRMEMQGLADVLRCAEQQGEQFFLLVLDTVQDPQNLGACMRSMVCRRRDIHIVSYVACE